MKKLQINNEKIKQIYEVSYSVAESKGKKRQNIINEIIIEELKNKQEYMQCTFKQEHILKKDQILWGERFSVDVAVFLKGKLIEIILIKAPASNVGQNNINTINGKSGEIDRISNLKDVKLSLITFLPLKTAFFKKDETIKNIEKTNHSSFLNQE